MGLTVPALLALQLHRAINLAERLDHHGLSELYAHRSVWQLLRLLAPVLPLRAPLSQRARWRPEVSLACP
jgi:hypothetical protein